MSDRFELLKEIANLFIVQPSQIGSVIRQGVLSKIDPFTLVPFLQMRENYKSENILTTLKDNNGSV